MKYLPTFVAFEASALRRGDLVRWIPNLNGHVWTVRTPRWLRLFTRGRVLITRTVKGALGPDGKPLRLRVWLHCEEQVYRLVLRPEEPTT